MIVKWAAILKMNTKATELNPQQNLENKRNFQRFILIEKDGNKLERVILFVSNSELREQIICAHFLSRYVQFFIKEFSGVKQISRDEPWDFELELSNSEKLTIEITSIADQEDLFKKYKYEERLIGSTRNEKIEFHELEKLTFNFPDKEIEKKIEHYKLLKTKKNDLVTNPHFNQAIIFQSRFDENVKSFEDILRRAIEKKVSKNHPNKSDVILIIDNRTITFTLNQILEHLENMDDYFHKLPFKEVWLYTGYYSDLDGNNAEYSLVPLKITDEKAELIEKSLD